MSDDLVLTADKAKRTYRPRKQIHEYAEEVKDLTVKLHDAEAHRAMIDKPTVRFALGLLWKAMTHAK